MGAVRPLGNRFCRGGERAPPFLAPRIGWGRRQARWRKAPEGGARLTRALLPDSSPRERVPRAEMLLRDLVLRRGYCWPSLLLHCALHPLWGFVQVTHGEPRKSCSKVTDSCQHICQCRPPPLLPPPPPPPPPPRLLSAPGK
ncbi:hypothetical protein EI555_004152 [Monodon monoceros]|uniref:Uncharacterized protein n=1 Tax=Monodon monoceros TaxID=40151 RepID=A0A4U1EF11_MONMO|nr:hypothetical protein EI555_004152 [Monodon monoceros]